LKDVDLAHIFSASYTSFLLAPVPAWIVARALGKKTLINYRSGEAVDHIEYSAVARHVLANTDRLVVPSGYLAEIFRRFELQSDVVPNIIDLSQFHYRQRAALRPHLICTRGFHPYYGIDVVVRAFGEVQKAHPEAQLDLVGGGGLEGSIRDLVRDLNLSNVNFLGVISRQEIGLCYNRADIFVNASNLDNMPVSVLEAFASGTPVATTEPEGMKYIVSHERTGLLSPPGNPRALAQNILRLLREPDLAAELAQNAFKESSRYRWTAVRDQWLRLYADLMSQSRRSEADSTIAKACSVTKASEESE
jgi:L-malate glycosyltransferase